MDSRSQNLKISLSLCCCFHSLSRPAASELEFLSSLGRMVVTLFVIKQTVLLQVCLSEL
jgi:hypothetical protein